MMLTRLNCVKLSLFWLVLAVGLGCRTVASTLPKPPLGFVTTTIDSDSPTLRGNETIDPETPVNSDGVIPPPSSPAPTSTLEDTSSTAQVSVNAAQPIHPFSNEMLGVALSNWEHSWGRLFPSDVPGLADILKAADIGLIRYAGGLWSNWVGWERLPQRTPRTEWNPDPANYHPLFQGEIDPHTYAYHYGQDEIDSLAKLSQESGAEVMVQVNVAMSDPEMWADMAHYANVENDYAFKYWELGNEFDLECRDGSEACVQPDAYGSRAQSYTAALRDVDPSVTVVGGVPASAHAFFGANDYSGDTTEMSPWLFQGRDAGVQSLSFHWYTDCNLSSLDNVLTYAWEEGFTAWQHTYSRQWSRIGPQRVEEEVIGSAGLNLTQGITELNIDACNFERAPINSNHLNAVWMADVIGRLGYNGLDYVTWYTGYGTQQQGYPAIATVEDYYYNGSGGGPIYLRPSYYTLFLYGNFFGDQYVQSSSPDDERLSVWASTDSQEPGTLKLIVVNISDSPATEPIVISGFEAVSGKKYALLNPNPLDMTDNSNGPGHGSTINGLTLTPENVLGATAVLEANAPSVLISNGQIIEEFPPFSVTAIVLNDKSVPTVPVVPRTWMPFLVVDER